MSVRASAVSRRLGQNPEWSKSEYLTSRIRGWGNYTSGYEVTQLGAEVVRVGHNTGDWGRGMTAERRIKIREDHITAYAEWLSRWYDVTRPGNGTGLSLEVRVKA
jgi:hypothetical protein